MRHWGVARWGVFVFTAGWSGDCVLARLLTAGGHVRSFGRVLQDPVKDPQRALRECMIRETDGLPVVFVHPDDLWLANALDPHAFVRDLQSAGHQIWTLSRHSDVDRALSRALCGPRCEVLPPRPRQVEADEVAVFAKHNEYIRAWLDALPARRRVVFETDLARDSGRADLVASVALELGLPRWSGPDDAHVPTADRLWRLVRNSADLREQLRSLNVAQSLTG